MPATLHTGRHLAQSNTQICLWGMVVPLELMVFVIRVVCTALVRFVVAKGGMKDLSVLKYGEGSHPVFSECPRGYKFLY
eukprot:SAG31_NODE_360_length_17025_cov_5.362460_14_plen_79_part_00